ncbi:plastocyanin/azurin family copper-binding protein [Pontibacter korlensis]|uniref:Blue (type 1) copper domain-containing protein n=1 Tax=Pontibacter korlensis TaxID=400092 RepID=A0A0E3UY00_9BACT|nr:plastocyanin/azurin family copper-binding protein [Pontibacter korlensis]AKD04702.1 hypothetical protein PKOR_18360 [Pontibacter korlensis]
MNKLLLYILPLLVVLLGCDPPQTDGETSTAGTNKDTATAASAPLVEDPDTTLQPVQHLELRALGNTIDEIRYSTDTLETKAGAMVKLTFINEGVDMPMVHNVVFTASGKYKQVALAGAKVGASGNYVPESDLILAATPMALPGQTVELEFTAPTEPGLYDYVCTYPGYWKRMNGVLVVK